MEYKSTKYCFAQIVGLLLMIFAFSLASCTDDAEQNGEYGKPVTIHAVITARPNVGTRASVYKAPVNDYELINDWFIVIANASHEVVKIISRDDYKINPAPGGYVVEREAFEFEINAGTYDVYSFANFSKTSLETAFGSAINIGTNIAALDNKVHDINAITANGTTSLSTYIPMSGKKHVTFTNSGLQVDEFEVIRMMAKMEFDLRNSSTKDITLKYVKMTPVNRGNITIVPSTTTLVYDNEIDPEILPSGVTTETVMVNFPSLTVLPATSYTTTKENLTFYIRESLASTHPTKHFMLNFGIIRDGKPEEVLYSMSGSNFTGINRNDWVNIPIRFTDYLVDLKVDFYPPIGGYPAVIDTNSPEEFYCSFGTEGTFAIMPTVKNAYSEALLYQSGLEPYYEFSITGVGGDMSIFTIVPYEDLITHEIVGELNNNHGTAYVDVDVTVHNGGIALPLYKRRIYIIR